MGQPLIPTDGFGWFLDGNGDAVLMIAGVMKGKLTKAGGFAPLAGQAFVGNLTGNVTGNLTGNVTGNIAGGTVAGTVASRTRKIRLPLGAWTPHASTPPTAQAVGLYQGLAFDADNEVLYSALEVPADWDGASDLVLKVAWTNEPATAIADTKTVKWDGAWRSKPSLEVADAGTAGAATTTYTQSGGGGVDKEIHVTSLALAYDDGDQPIAAGDDMSFSLARDMTGDTHATDAVVLDAWIEYSSTVLAVE